MKSCWMFMLGLLLPVVAVSQLTENRAAYMHDRATLTDSDSLLRFSNLAELSVSEQELDNRMKRVQWEMLESYRLQHFFPPARYFTQSKAHIESTPLFRLFRTMPKGGILHLHIAAGGDARWVADKVIASPDAYVYWGESSDQYVKGQLRYFFEETVPAGYISAPALQEQVPHLKDSLVEMLTFDESIDRDSVDIWAEFELVFKRIYGFISYRSTYIEYMTASLDSLAVDGIQHADLRMLLSDRLYDEDHKQGEIPVDTLLVDLEKIIADVQTRYPDFTAKAIYTYLRFFDRETQLADLHKAFALRKKYPHLIKGYDLVAEEDNGHPTLYHRDNFLQLDSLEEAYGIDMPLYLHDGESDWASSDNLYDAILLGTKRIGHGFNLFRFPSLVDEVKKRNICLEVNPLSNQMLGYVRDLRIHPGSYYLTMGVPLTISSDDPLIFDYAGLSYDFWSVYLAWELDLRQVKQLCRNSLVYSTLDAEEKKRALAAWETRWNQFVEDALRDWEK